MAGLKDFMLSRVRVKLLKTFLSDPQEMFYVRQLTRLTSEEINAVRRELQRLEGVGFLKSEKRGNRLYYYPSKHYDFYNELIALVAKTTGLGAAIRKHKNKVGKLKFVMLSGRFVRGTNSDPNDVDLLVVGTVILPELSQLVRKEETSRSTEINYTVMTLEEFEFRKARRDPFLAEILSGSRVMIIGDEEDMLSHKASQEEQQGTSPQPA